MPYHEAEPGRRALDDVSDVRVLRHLDVSTGATGRGTDAVAGFGVVVDVKTTGANVKADTVIELAARRFAYDERHMITRIDRPYRWREDPGRSLQEDVIRDTGLRDDDLVGRRIDECEASRIIGSADVRIAHEAAFDRPFVERRLPGIVGLPWACSIEDVGWAEMGYESAKLGWLLMQCGLFREANGAASDVDATIQILQHEIDPGRTALDRMMERGSADSWIVRAFGASFEDKDKLRSRRYRWNADQKVWWKDVRDKAAEETWLAANVYSMPGSSRTNSADFEPLNWRTRYAR